jgi:ribose transport system permease protein
MNESNIKKPNAVASFFRNLSGQTIWMVFAVLVITITLMEPKFISSSNILNVLRQVSIVGLISLGMTVVLIGGNFDLSTGAILTLAAVVSVNIGPENGPLTALAIIIPLLLGVIVGLLNGLLVGLLKANSIIVTVGTQFMVAGATLIYTGGQHVWVWSPTQFYEAISGGYLMGIPNPIFIFLTLTIITQIILKRTSFGRYVYALGNNDDASRLMGIKTNLIRMSTYVFSGFTAAAAGILLASRVKNLDPTIGLGYEFQALTAVVLGGTKTSGGEGRIYNTLAGVLTLGIISNSMTLLNISYNLQLLIRGLILLTAVAIDAKRNQSVAR